MAELGEDGAARNTLEGPDACRNDNPNGAAIYRPFLLSRPEVVAQVEQARAEGTVHATTTPPPLPLPRSLPATHRSTPRGLELAPRAKAKISRKQS